LSQSFASIKDSAWANGPACACADWSPLLVPGGKGAD
jgi:hypothetical protein